MFYRALEEDTGGYFPCADSTDNLCGPRVARSDGWVPAVVERAHHGWDGEQVLVRHAWPHWREPGGRPWTCLMIAIPFKGSRHTGYGRDLKNLKNRP